jgi:hypothetical protein
MIGPSYINMVWSSSSRENGVNDTWFTILLKTDIHMNYTQKFSLYLKQQTATETKRLSVREKSVLSVRTVIPKNCVENGNFLMLLQALKSALRSL